MTPLGPVYVIGAGGHAKVALRALIDLGYNVRAVFDDDRRRWGGELCGVPIRGPIDRLRDELPLPAVIAIGDNAARRAVAERLTLEWLTLVAAGAMVDSTARLGPGTVVFRGAIIQADAQVGVHAIVNTAASIDHDCRVGDYAHVAPGAHLAGEVVVGEQALIGIGAVAVPGVRIGPRAVIGAGAAVVRDIPANVVAVGVPARILRRAGGAS